MLNVIVPIETKKALKGTAGHSGISLQTAALRAIQDWLNPPENNKEKRLDKSTGKREDISDSDQPREFSRSVEAITLGRILASGHASAIAATQAVLRACNELISASDAHENASPFAGDQEPIDS